MKSMYIKNLKRKKFIIIPILIILFINIIWVSFIIFKYNKFIENIPKHKHGSNFISKDGYTYGVKRPDYLQLTGNLYITKEGSRDSLLIWPLPLGGGEYGVIISDEENGIAQQIYVDENMQAIKKDNTLHVKLIEENKDAIEEIFLRANKMWDLDDK